MSHLSTDLKMEIYANTVVLLSLSFSFITSKSYIYDNILYPLFLKEEKYKISKPMYYSLTNGINTYNISYIYSKQQIEDYVNYKYRSNITLTFLNYLNKCKEELNYSFDQHKYVVINHIIDTWTRLLIQNDILKYTSSTDSTIVNFSFGPEVKNIIDRLPNQFLLEAKNLEEQFKHKSSLVQALFDIIHFENKPASQFTQKNGYTSDFFKNQLIQFFSSKLKCITN